MTDQKFPLISIVVLNYNSGKLILNCVNSVLQSDYDNFEVIVVDNNSQDGSQKECKIKFPSIRLIENNTNYGYCEGNNIGIRSAKGDFVVVLNPDTEVEPSWLTKLHNAFKENGKGLYQPKICSLPEKKILQSTGNMIQLFGFGYAKDKGLLDNKKYQEIESICYPAGTCIFSSKEVFYEIGLFDPFIFLYHDDLDLGWKAAKRGVKSFFVPSATIYHTESYALKWSARKYFWLERNRRYCMMIHYSKETYKKLKFYLLFVDLLVWIFYISKGFLITKIKVEIDLKKNKDRIKQKALQLEKERMISDKEVIKIFTDSIFVPRNVSGKNVSKLFNFILTSLSKKARKKIK